MFCTKIPQLDGNEKFFYHHIYIDNYKILRENRMKNIIKKNIRKKPLSIKIPLETTFGCKGQTHTQLACITNLYTVDTKVGACITNSRACRYIMTYCRYSPVWNTYLASACMRVAGQVGGLVSPLSRFSRNVSSNPNPLGPSLVLHLKLWLKSKHKK